MSLVLNFPTNAELNEVVQAFKAKPEDYIGASILPVNTSMAQKVRWDERDADRGMTAPHVMGTDPKMDNRQGAVTREFEPIPFKETDLLTESEILRAREYGTLAGVIDLSNEIARIAKNRWDKTQTRMETLRWAALLGVIAINENGVKVDETFPVQAFTPATPWSTPATSTPLKDLDTCKLLFRGTGASAAGAKLFVNQTNANRLVENTNANDLRGFQNSNFVDLTYSIGDLNKILMARGLPEIVVYDEGYIDEAGTFVNFIPDTKAVLVGKRPSGENVGDWMSTPTLHNSANGMPAPGYFSVIEVNGKPSEQVGSVSMSQLGSGKNPKIEITGGIYGGPRVIYPKSIITLTVG